MTPEWTDFTFICGGCHRQTRLDRATLMEQNAVEAALGNRQTLAETAANFVYCGECNGTPIEGEHDVPKTPWELAMERGEYPPQLPE